VFLIHYLSTLFMMWIAEQVFQLTGIFGIFGEPDVREAEWLFWIYAFALGGGALVYWGVERPFERVRARLRGGRMAARADSEPPITEPAI